jgi:hypothetical protein
VRRGPKGMGDRAVGSSPRGGGENGPAAQRRRGDGSLVGRRGHEAEEERRGDRVLRRALVREDERERKEGRDDDGRAL